MKAGHVWGALYFSSNFSEALAERRESGKDTSEEALRVGQLDVWLDMSGDLFTLFLKNIYNPSEFLQVLKALILLVGFKRKTQNDWPNLTIRTTLKNM